MDGHLSGYEGDSLRRSALRQGQGKGDIIEIVDRSTGQKLVMLEDGRTG